MQNFLEELGASCDCLSTVVHPQVSLEVFLAPIASLDSLLILNLNLRPFVSSCMYGLQSSTRGIYPSVCLGRDPNSIIFHLYLDSMSYDMDILKRSQD